MESERGRVVFILGAGFGADAGAEVGPIRVLLSTNGSYDFECRYPLVRDLAEVCFPGEHCPSLEQRLHRAMAAGDLEPLRRLCERMMKTDWDLVPRLIGASGSGDSSYRRFFERFEEADFVTFNYDSLVEGVLFRLGRWIPSDGYGVSVVAAANLAVGGRRQQGSRSLVLHLHGSLCVYELNYRVATEPGYRTPLLEQTPDTKYLFDPDSVGELFDGWRWVGDAWLGPDPLEERVIAPVPDKASGLRKEFVTAARDRALELIRAAEAVIVIGYSFNPHDAASFDPLVKAVAARREPLLTIVDPTADSIAQQLEGRFNGLVCKPIPQRFSEWAEGGFHH
jgi:hypothetical protein